MAIHITCDCCLKEPEDQDFACDITVMQRGISFAESQITPQMKTEKKIYQICKGCFYTHISKLFNKDEKDNESPKEPKLKAKK